MRYKRYVTERVRKWWNKQNLGDEYVKALKQFECSSSPMKQEEKLNSVVYLTRLAGKSGRPTFAWMSRTKEDATVYVLREAFGHDEYEVEMMGASKLKTWADKNILTPEEEQEVAQVLNEMLTENEPETESKPCLSGKEKDFLSGQLSINHDLFQYAIFETKTWVDYVQSDKLEEFDFYAVANALDKHIYENLGSSEGWQNLIFKDDIIYIYHKGDNWILDGIYPFDADDIDFDALLQMPAPTDFRRGYPDSYLQDQDEWRRMELERKSNMVLSEDQVAIVSDKIQYPLFITGRAGSGKSTILQYLFAEIILRYVQHKTDGADTIMPPVYLSYSENLIQDAKSLSQLLLEKNRCYKNKTKELGITFEKNIKPEFDGMFYVFQTLVKNCIRKYDVDYLNSHFTSNSYISFATFNSKWQLKFGNSREANKKYGPSLCWHVIRTYIKGWDSTKLMTPQDYAQLPDDRKTVSDETFALVYKKVWENWYSKLEGVWDDQDIVRYCIDNGYAEESFSGIFCDEAQDFTRVELDFILKLSSFANRTITDINDVKKLPFVFAGDEFQTLNPTGFSWDSLSSYFVERLAQMTGLTQNNIHLEDAVELSENFRSTRQVVKLANHIQLLRATRFQSASKPQSPHFSQEGSAIVCLSPTDKTVFDKLKSMEVILIVPAADGVSASEYVVNSPLKDMIDIVDGVPQGLTILNPTQAKGLEYPNVAVYGFDCSGAYANLSLKSLNKWYSNPIENAEADIELKYQLSNAYVAVTRASNKLFIIDKFDDSAFWAFAYAHPKYNGAITTLKENMLNSLTAEKRKLWPEDVIGWINYGTPDNITNENVDYMKLEENRMALEKHAESLRDAELMRQAACRNMEAGRKKDEDRCWAKALSFEEKYILAAEKFEKAEMPSDAVENYWLALCDTLPETGDNKEECLSIVNKIARHKDKVKNAKVSISAYAKQKYIQIRDLKFIFDEIITYLNKKDEAENLVGWVYLLNLVIPKVQPNKKSASDITVIIVQCAQLESVGIDINASIIADLAYKSNCIDKAVSLWEGLDEDQRPDEYYVEKAKTIPYPDRIGFLTNTKLEDKDQRIMEEYHKHKQVVLSFLQRVTVSNSYFPYVNSKGVSKITNSDKKECVLFLPTMLSLATSLEHANMALSFASTGCDFIVSNELLMESFNKLRFDGKIDSSTLEKKDFVDKKATSAKEAILYVNKAHNSDFIKVMLGKNQSNQERMNGLCKTIRHFAHKPFLPFVVLEVAKEIAARGFDKESIMFYDIVRGMGDSEAYGQMIDAYNIIVLERCADVEKNKAMRTKAQELRKELSIEEGDLSNIVEFYFVNPLIESLYKELLSINGEEVVAEDPEDADIEEYEDVTESNKTGEDVEDIEDDALSRMPVSSSNNGQLSISFAEFENKVFMKPDPSASAQKFRIQDYEITWIPKKEELNISYVEDDSTYSMKVVNGKMKSLDFDLTEQNELYIPETGNPTPFMLFIDSERIVLEVYDAGSATGMRLVFELNH